MFENWQWPCCCWMTEGKGGWGWVENRRRGHWRCDRQRMLWGLKGSPSEVKHGAINNGEAGAELF